MPALTTTKSLIARLASTSRSTPPIAAHSVRSCSSVHSLSSPFVRSSSSATPISSTTSLFRYATRKFSVTKAVRHGPIDRPEPGTGIKVTFRESNGTDIRTVECNEGDDLLSIAHEYDIDLEGACEGSIACSTCHVVLSNEMYDTLPEPSDEENDMLDLAFGLTDTSRLGCQVHITKDVDGLVATLPSATRNMFVDGAKPTKH